MYKKWCTEDKSALVQRYQAGESVLDICNSTGVSRSTFYTWLKSYKTTASKSKHEVSVSEY